METPQPYDLSCYDETFSRNAGVEAARMAPWLMPILRDHFKFQSLLDVGCGTGEYVRWCSDNGIVAIGVDGSEAAIRIAHESDLTCFCVDLRRPRKWPHMYDLVLSFEVAEHIEAEYTDLFLDCLTQSADTVVMTAAQPGQQGLQHVNEQTHNWWKARFAARGWQFAIADTIAVLKKVNYAAMGEHTYVTPWLRPNFMVFRRGA